jgi:hypothetical protein
LNIFSSLSLGYNIKIIFFLFGNFNYPINEMVIPIQMAPELVKMDQKGPNFEFRSFFILFSKKDNPLSYTIKLKSMALSTL